MTRMASLKKDQSDISQFRHHRSRNIGHSVSWEWYQPMPLLFTRESSQVNLIGHYRGRSAFMICNGPSLVSGRYDLSLLKKPGVVTWGINNGPKTVRPNFWTCVDDPKRFLKSIWLDPTICKIVPHAHAEKPLFDSEKWEDLVMPHPVTGKPSKILVGDCPNMLYFHRNSKFMADRYLYEDTINWGNAADYGGGRSVMLATMRLLFILGFRKVFMIGADFKMNENYTYHFDEQRSKGAVKGNLSTYDRMKNEYFPALKPIFDKEGFEVYNCTEGSELKVFPFVKYEEAIEYCTSYLGNLENERTWGLYSKPEERSKWKNEPAQEQKAYAQTIINKPSSPIYNSQSQNISKTYQNQNFEKTQHYFAENNVEQENENIIESSVADNHDIDAKNQIEIPQAPAKPIKIPEIVRSKNINNMVPKVVNPQPISQIYPKPPNTNYVKNVPCGPVQSAGSSTKINKNPNDKFITLADNGM